MYNTINQPISYKMSPHVGKVLKTGATEDLFLGGFFIFYGKVCYENRIKRTFYFEKIAHLRFAVRRNDVVHERVFGRGRPFRV